MRAVGIRTLKAKLSEYVRLVSAGETVLVTHHDRVVAELVPPNAGRAATVADAFLAEAVRSGRIRPAVARTGRPPPSLPVAPTAALLAELDRDRGER